MTDAQRAVYEFVARFLNGYGYAPTVREIQSGLQYKSPATVHVHLEALREEGYLDGSGRKLRLGWKTA